jgi:nucleoside-diphosphate-sugar epimerase
MPDQLVLVTGGSGFIAGHCILRLLEEGFRVRATVRSLDREPQVRAVLTAAGMQHGDRLGFVAADLLSDDGWSDALRDVDGVLHVASPVQPGHVEDEDALIRPAREGSLRVLRAARDAGVGRVVLTSAFHAVGFGHPHDHGVFTEDDWSVMDGPGMDAYGRSKVLAERAAWEFVEGEGGPELVTILPVAVMGPVMGSEISGSNHILQRLLDGAMPAVPNLAIPIVDVRDVASAHVAALTSRDAAGRRFIVSSGEDAIPMLRIGEILREHLGAAASKVPTSVIPDEVLRSMAASDPALAGTAAELGLVKRVSNERARRILHLDPRPSADAIVAGGESMVAAGLV